MYSRDVVLAENSHLFDASFGLSFDMIFSHIPTYLPFWLFNIRRKSLARVKPFKL